MPIVGFHHVSINVHDADLVRDFYVDVLGLEELPRPDFGFPGHWLAKGAQQLHLIQVPDHEPRERGPIGPHFALLVSRLDEVREELRARGFEVSEPFEIAGVGRQSFMKDPAGNVVELKEPVG